MGKPSRKALSLAAGMLLGAAALPGQHLPVTGCNAALSCAEARRFRGYRVMRDAQGEGNTAFSVGMGFEGGINLRIVRPPPRRVAPEDPIDAAVRLFLARHPLRKPSPPPAPKDRRPDP